MEKQSLEEGKECVRKAQQLAEAGKLNAARQFNIDAILHFTRAIKQQSNDYRYYLIRGDCYVKISDFEKAVSDAEMAMRLNPSDVRGYFTKGKALVGLKKYDDAEICFLRVLAEDPDCEDARRELNQIPCHRLVGHGYSKEDCQMALEETCNIFEDALEWLEKNKPLQPKEEPLQESLSKVNLGPAFPQDSQLQQQPVSGEQLRHLIEQLAALQSNRSSPGFPSPFPTVSFGLGDQPRPRIRLPFHPRFESANSVQQLPVEAPGTQGFGLDGMSASAFQLRSEGQSIFNSDTPGVIGSIPNVLRIIADSATPSFPTTSISNGAIEKVNTDSPIDGKNEDIEKKMTDEKEKDVEGKVQKETSEAKAEASSVPIQSEKGQNGNQVQSEEANYDEYYDEWEEEEEWQQPVAKKQYPEYLTDPKNPKKLTSIYVGNLQHLDHGDEPQLRKMFENCGAIKSVYIVPGKHFGFVNFMNFEGAATALQTMKGYKNPLGKVIILSYQDPDYKAATAADDGWNDDESEREGAGTSASSENASGNRAIWIGNVFVEDVNELVQIFKWFGPITSRAYNEEKGWGIIQYTDPLSAMKAVEAMDGQVVSGVRIKVNYREAKDCKNWMKGTCPRQRDCQFKHDPKMRGVDSFH